MIKQRISVAFMLCSIIFVVCLIAANLLETKVIQLGSLTLTAGILVFPLSYIINDCITEVWGFRHARLVIWSGFAMNAFVILLGFLAVKLPSPTYWHEAEHFNFVFGFAPRIVVASLTAFVVGSLLNSLVFSRLKKRHNGKHFSLRAIVSTLVGETVDSLIFFPIAFGGLVSWSELIEIMLLQITLKTAYEIVSLPVTIKAVGLLRCIDKSEIDL